LSYVTSAAKVKDQAKKDKGKLESIAQKKFGPETLTPLLKQQFQEMNMNINDPDKDYSAFYDKVVEANFNRIVKLEQSGQYEITKTISMMQRRIAVNYKTKKKEEFLTWHELWKIEDVSSIEFMCGVDKQVQFKPVYSQDPDTEGQVSYKPVNPVQIFTIPFSPEKVDEVLAKYETDGDSVQLSIVTGARDYSCSLEEFRDCKFEELALRGKMGYNAAGYPITFKFSDLNAAKRLELEQQQQK
jgi:hypothetical protein